MKIAESNLGTDYITGDSFHSGEFNVTPVGWWQHSGYHTSIDGIMIPLLHNAFVVLHYVI